MDEGRKRVIGIMAAILASLHMLLNCDLASRKFTCLSLRRFLV
jgi:hypothetical protein